ncbi:MAG TPA: hypothetical protein VFX03_01360, partial [Thermomicrobiales bacterium]|nr:hypothetical protein [Thermomicrobiales bacterium]
QGPTGFQGPFGEYNVFEWFDPNAQPADQIIATQTLQPDETATLTSTCPFGYVVVGCMYSSENFGALPLASISNVDDNSCSVTFNNDSITPTDVFATATCLYDGVSPVG